MTSLIERLNSAATHAMPKADEDTFAEAARALTEAQAEIARLKGERDGAKESLAAWFDLSKRLEAEVAPVLLDAFQGYLRTCRSGGMPTNLSDTASTAFSEFCRLYLGVTLVPFFRTSDAALQSLSSAAEEALGALEPFARSWPDTELGRRYVSDNEFRRASTAHARLSAELGKG